MTPVDDLLFGHAGTDNTREAVGGAGRGPATDGPLSSGNGIHDPIPRGSICAPGGKQWAFGLQQFTNYGNTIVVLDRVVLLHPHNERLIGS